MNNRKSVAMIIVLVLGGLFGILETAEATIPQIEREALIALYKSTIGLGWDNNNNWRNSENTEFSPSGTECSWFGVTCTGDHVTELDLRSNQLSGSIPFELGNLSNLQVLWLHDNQLSGSIPPELGNLPNLTWLFLDSNLLTGSIPAELGNLSNLEQLCLSSNQLSGGIPAELGNLSNLEQLCLSSNQLSGSMPAELGNLNNLDRLDLSFNQLSGSIPSELGNLSNLWYLTLSSNQLSGSIPSELGNLSNLFYLFLDSNQLSGSIPAELGNLSNLFNLWLANNQLSGSIPAELGNLSYLGYLRLDSNQLSGSIPPELAHLSNLYSSYNDLGYNALWTNDATLEAFLDSRDPDWYQTQTIAPSGVGIDSIDSSSATLSWTPIEYTGDAGGYAVFVHPQPPSESIFHDGFEGRDTEWWGLGNPWVVTTDKTDTSVSVDGLEAGKSYDFVLRTVTEPHENNDNQVISDVSATVSGTTSP